MNSINQIVKKLRENRILNEREDYNKIPRERLIKMAQEGDQLAVETLIKTHKDFIRKMSAKYFLTGGDRDDVEQLATIAFWDAIMSFKSGDFEAFAGMTIKRKMIDAVRSDTAQKNQILNQASSTEETGDSDDEFNSTPGINAQDEESLSLEDEVEGKEGFRDLVKFMETSLSDVERDVIRKYIEGYKVSEIAEELNMKYKSAENALMRVKNKVADYIRRRESYQESKKMDEAAGVEFTDEEKRVLVAVLDKIEEKKTIRESKVMKLREAYENYTESQLDAELDRIDDKVEDIIRELSMTDYDDRDDLMDSLDDLKSMLVAMEEYLTDEQYKKSEDLRDKIFKAEDTEFEGPARRNDPYKERGLRRSDFY